jgi:hypothetical protein
VRVFLFTFIETKIKRFMLCRVNTEIGFVPTPKHGSWLNVAEIELGLLKRLGIGSRVGSRQELEKQVKAYQTTRNTKQVKVEFIYLNQCRETSKELCKVIVSFVIR